MHTWLLVHACPHVPQFACVVSGVAQPASVVAPSGAIPESVPGPESSVAESLAPESTPGTGVLQPDANATPKPKNSSTPRIVPLRLNRCDARRNDHAGRPAPRCGSLRAHGTEEEGEGGERLDSLVALIGRRAETIKESFYDIGHAFAEIVQDKLYEAEGHASFEDFLAAHGLGSRAQAFKLIAVATELTRDQALALGQERAAALVAFAAATREPDSAASLARVDAKVGKKRVSEASVQDIRDAAARAAKPKTAEQRAAAAADRATGKHVAAWLARSRSRAPASSSRARASSSRSRVSRPTR